MTNTQFTAVPLKNLPWGSKKNRLACWCTFQKIIIAYGSVTCTYAVLAYIQYLVMDTCSRRSVVKYVYLFLKSIYLKLLVFMGVMILGFTQLTSCMFFPHCSTHKLNAFSSFLFHESLYVFCFWASFFVLFFRQTENLRKRDVPSDLQLNDMVLL